MSNWKKKMTFRDKCAVEREINGEKFKFYPNRMALLKEASDLSIPVAQALNTIFADEDRDAGTKVMRQRDAEGYSMEDISTEPLSVEMAQYRQSERNKALTTLLTTMTDRNSMMVLGRMLMDSLREEFPYSDERDSSEVSEFLFGDSKDWPGLDIPTMAEFFRGWISANAQVFGSQGEQVVGLIKRRLELLQDDSPSEEGEETEDPTNGDSSKTPSLQLLDTDSHPSI